MTLITTTGRRYWQRGQSVRTWVCMDERWRWERRAWREQWAMSRRCATTRRRRWAMSCWAMNCWTDWRRIAPLAATDLATLLRRRKLCVQIRSQMIVKVSHDVPYRCRTSSRCYVTRQNEFKTVRKLSLTFKCLWNRNVKKGANKMNKLHRIFESFS